MAQVVSIGLLCANRAVLEISSAFYREIFQLCPIGANGGSPNHLTDGTTDLTLSVEGGIEPELKAPGCAPCIYSFGIEALDYPELIKRIEANGGRILSDPTSARLQYSAPDGSVCAIALMNEINKSRSLGNARIAHLGIEVKDLELARKFYENVFNFENGKTTQKRTHVSHHMTDVTRGFDITLTMYADVVSREAEMSNNTGSAIYHWGIEMSADLDGLAARIGSKGGSVLSPPGCKDA
jgi:predicted enzyme related to lactoylglutathione lyase